MNRATSVWYFFGLLVVGAACSSAAGNDTSPPITPPVDAGIDVSAGGAAGAPGTGGSGGALISTDGSADSGWDPPFCANKDLTGDLDKDGYSVEQGDCNDCTPLMNPGAYDYPGDGIDEDCNGVDDDEPSSCDDGLAEDSKDAMDAARALGLCRTASAGATGKSKTWGVISAAYVFPDGSKGSQTPKTFQGCVGDFGEGQPPNPASYGLLSGFGNSLVPRQGSTLLALSSGIARSGVVANSPGGAFTCTRSDMPAGFPTPSNNCSNQPLDSETDAYDAVALEIVVRAPTNAKSFAFDFDFHTYEFPDWVCDQYNDYFVALVSPKRLGADATGNISFDTKGNPVSVNNAWLETCETGTYKGKSYPCSLGAGELTGTGFDGRGATGWLETHAPVQPGEQITIRFAIWDMGDETYDSTVLIDNFRWDIEEIPPSTLRPPK